MASRDPRYQVDIPVDYETRDLFLGSRVTNISRGGLFIRTDNPLPVQTEVNLSLHLPEDDRVIQARGRVVWNYDVPRNSFHVVSGMGIKFIDLSADQMTRIETSLKRLGNGPVHPGNGNGNASEAV
jgi:type IV pilus assembly protein PilZ